MTVSYTHLDVYKRQGLLMAEGSRAAMEVEDISRAVQRDARRYDGGFTMF